MYLFCVSALGIHFPGIPKVNRVFLHLKTAAGQVIVLDAIEVPTQATHLFLGEGRGAHRKPWSALWVGGRRCQKKKKKGK